jgi:hypothetical protein
MQSSLSANNQNVNQSTNQINYNINNNSSSVEEEYINNLQKKIYYLELEMKLMKDKEVDTKNKVGGYGKILYNNHLYFLNRNTF